MRFSLPFSSVFAQAVLHQEFVGPEPDKLLVHNSGSEKKEAR
jgi:hypothetical protein